MIIPFKVIIIVVQLMFAGINMFLALLKTHFIPRYAWAKMSFELGQKHIYAREHQRYCYIIITLASIVTYLRAKINKSPGYNTF